MVEDSWLEMDTSGLGTDDDRGIDEAAAGEGV